MAGFGKVLKEFRKEFGLSQMSLALQLGTTQRHVSFLETGRSQPTRQMIGRIATDLDLSAAQRAAIFEASGFRNPYTRRKIDDEDVQAALDMIEHRILANWIFPGFALDRDWNILRSNKEGRMMLAMFSAGQDTKEAGNFLELLLSPTFRSMIQNWEEAAPAFYFRLLSASGESAFIRDVLERARKDGVFEDIARTISDQSDVPVYVPLTLSPSEGMTLQITSFLGRLASVHDSFVEGVEVELLVPLDDNSEALLKRMIQ